MGDGDEFADALADGLAAELRDALFGHHEVDEAAMHGLHGPGGVAANDAGGAGAAYEGTRRQDDDGAPGRGRCADREDSLATRAAVEVWALSLGGDIAGEVDGHGVVDGDEVLDLEQHAQVVGVGEIVEFVGGVAIDAGEVFGGDLAERAGDHFADVVGFVPAGDDALIDEVGDAARKELGMDAEVVAVLEENGEGGGDIADAELECAAVVTFWLATWVNMT